MRAAAATVMTSGGAQSTAARPKLDDFVNAIRAELGLERLGSDQVSRFYLNDFESVMARMTETTPTGARVPPV